MGQSAPAVLAVADSLCHRLDGGKPFCRPAGGVVRRRAVIGGDSLLFAGALPDDSSWPELDHQQGAGRRFQGQDFDCAVCGGDRRDRHGRKCQADRRFDGHPRFAAERELPGRVRIAQVWPASKNSPPRSALSSTVRRRWCTTAAR